MNCELGEPITYRANLKPAVFGLIAAALFLSLTLVSCSNQDEPVVESGVVQNPTYGAWQDREEPPIRFELEQTFGAKSDEDGFMFAASYGMRGPVADSAGNIYVLDTERSKLVSFDPEGNLRWQTGEEGRGPGDFLRPRGMAVKGQYLYLDNVNGSRIDKYDLKGNFVTSMSLPSDESRFMQVRGFLNNGLLVATSSIMGALGSQISILNIDDSLSLVNQFDVEVLQDSKVGDGVSASFSVSVFDSLIAPGNFENYALNFYNTDGERVKSITRDFQKLVRPGVFNSSSTRSVRLFGSLGSPIKLSEQFFITFLHWPTNVEDPDDYVRRSRTGNVPDLDFASSLDLFRSDGTLLYSVEQNQYRSDIGYIGHVDGRGKVYTRTSNPYPQIRRYRVVIED